jgi:chorismate synthase
MNGNKFGKLFQIATFGESHGPGIGCIISGCPAGVKIDASYIQHDLDRRRPGQSMVTTSRNEPDQISLLSGLEGGYTTGAPLGMVIYNKDAKSSKYEPFVTAPRPSHGDFTYSAKFGTRSWAGGGRSSARETANWVAAGAVAKKVLEDSIYDVQIKAHVNQIGDLRAPDITFEDMVSISENNPVRCGHLPTAKKMEALITKYQKEGDSIGGSVYFEAHGVPCGLGAPRFDSFEARLAHAMLSLPATTAFEFGLGRSAREYTGFERNDPFIFDDDGSVVPASNNHGGIQGGITTGEVIFGEVTFHAPTSIVKKQQTVDWATKEEKEIQVIGRHDPVLPPRGVPVVESLLNLIVLDFMLLGGRINPDRIDGKPGVYDTDYHPVSPQN